MSRISTLALDFSSKFYFDGVALIEKGSATVLRSFIIRVLVFVTSSVLAVGAWQPASANTGDVVIARGLAAAPDSPALRDPVAAPEQGDTTVLFAGDDSETSPIGAVDVPEGVLSDDSVGGSIESVDEFSTVTSLGDGLYKTELSLSPLNTLSSDGQWVPINTDVEVQSDGDVVVADNPLNPVVDDTGVGSGVLSVTAHGVQVTSQLLGAASVDAEQVTGDASSIVFDSVAAHADHMMSFGSNYVKDNVVLDSALAARSWSWKISISNGSIHRAADGSFEITDAVGDSVFVIPTPIAWDSASTPSTTVLDTKLAAQSDGSVILTATVPTGWFTDSRRVFPVTIDPSTTTLGDSALTAYKSDGATRSDYVHVGNTRESSSNRYWRTIVNYGFGTFIGDQVLDAQLSATYAGAGTTTPQSMSVSTTKCTNGYSCVGDELASFTVDTSGATRSSNTALAKQISDWVNGGLKGQRLILRGAETSGTYTYKMLNTSVTVLTKGFPKITSTSPGLNASTSQNPEISAVATDPAKSGLEYRYIIVGATADGLPNESVVYGNSGWVDEDFYRPVQKALSPNTTYFYKVLVRDGFDAEYLSTVGVSADKYFGTLSRADSGWLKFQTTKDPVQPTIGSVSLAKNDVISSVTPAITVNLPAATAGDYDEYIMTIATSPTGQSGSIASTGLLPTTVGSTQTWNVPSGFLQDGQQYYLTVQTVNSGNGNQLPFPEWTIPFTVNQRLGLSVPSPMEAVGPLMVNLASGNIATSVSTPTISTLGGGIGFTFNYNSLEQHEDGLTGEYFVIQPGQSSADYLSGTADLVRVDPQVALKLDSTESPAVGFQPSYYAIRWTGYVTLPNNNSDYEFGMLHNNGATVEVSNKMFLDSWKDDSSTRNVHHMGNEKVAGTGLPRPITVEFYQESGSARAALYYKKTNASEWTLVPASMLSPKRSFLPDGWATSSIVAGALARYSSIVINDRTAVIEDRAGGSHTYRSNGTGGFTPPKGEYGTLVVETDHTASLTEDDGTVYHFDNNGKMANVSAPGDTRKPAAPVTVYDSSGNPENITDPLSSGLRVVTFTYSKDGENNCPRNTTVGSDVPSAGLLCKITFPRAAGTTGTQPSTDIYYDTDDRIISIVNPGSEQYSFAYNSAGVMTQMITPFANEQIANLGSLADQLVPRVTSFDSMKRPLTLALPQPGFTEETKQFTWGDSSTSVKLVNLGRTVRTVTFDSQWRQTGEISAMGYETTQQWGEFDSQTRVDSLATGLTTTRKFDRNGRVTDVYGPAPAACFTATSPTPVAAANCPVVVAHTKTAYDETLHGLATAYYSGTVPVGSGRFRPTVRHNND